MDWQTLLAYIAGTVDQELLLRNEYLVTENRVLRHLTAPDFLCQPGRIHDGGLRGNHEQGQLPEPGVQCHLVLEYAQNHRHCRPAASARGSSRSGNLGAYLAVAVQTCCAE